MIIFGVFILLAGFFTAYTLMPFFEESFRRKRLDFEEADTKETLAHRKEQILEALRDLEYDYKMNKIATPDYTPLKEKLTQEAVEIMKKLDELEKRSHSNGIGRQIRTSI